MGSTLAQAVKDADTVLVRQDRQLAGGGRDGFGLAHPVGQAPIEGAEGGIGAAEVHGRHAPDRGGEELGPRMLASSTAKVLATYVVEKGKPLASPAP